MGPLGFPRDALGDPLRPWETSPRGLGPESVLLGHAWPFDLAALGPSSSVVGTQTFFGGAMAHKLFLASMAPEKLPRGRKKNLCGCCFVLIL